MSFTSWLRNLKLARHLGNTIRNGRRAARSKPAAGFRPRLESLEERITPDAGDTLNAALLTGLGPLAGSYAVTERIGDGSFANLDVDLFLVNAQAGQVLKART